jgi:molecular chaperone GrpE
MTDPADRSETPQSTGAPADAENGGTETAALESRLMELENRVTEHQDKYLRLAAEFDNFRKRATRERENAEHHGQSVVIRGLLDSLDDLARFAQLDAWNTEVETVIDGARMVEQKMQKTLAGHGLEIVNPAGQPFDPAVHEAVSTSSAAAPEEDHLVAEVFQVGYVFNGKLLRPARVVVKQWAP